MHIFQGIANTQHHAYKEVKIFDNLKRYWITASISKKYNKITILCYDRGQTIPKSIKSKIKSKNFSYLKNVIEWNNATLLSNLLQGKIQSQYLGKEKGRWQGIKELKKLIEQNGSGKIQIFSNKGVATFELNNLGKSIYTNQTLPIAILGTLIKWEIQINQ